MSHLSIQGNAMVGDESDYFADPTHCQHCGEKSRNLIYDESLMEWVCPDCAEKLKPEEEED
jgi:hypothetical protein